MNCNRRELDHVWQEERVVGPPRRFLEQATVNTGLSNDLV